MKNFNRRDFIQSTTGLAAMALIGTSFEFKKRSPLLSFSTLGCPDWTFETIINFAAQNNYNGIELRGIKRELDLTKCPEFSSDEKIKETLKKVKDKNLHIVDLGCSSALHFDEGAERKKNLEEAKHFIDLAHKINCPYIRVFPNTFPKDKEHDAVIDLIVKGLTELGDHANGSQVKVLMETHGDVVKLADIKTIMDTANHKNTGLVWDMVNMWSITKEPPAQVYGALKKYIHHTHIKDALLVNGVLTYTLLGKGNMPVFEALDLLQHGGYTGYYSFEWEKLWHPEIEAPETALADYPKVMHQYFSKKQKDIF